MLIVRVFMSYMMMSLLMTYNQLYMKTLLLLEARCSLAALPLLDTRSKAFGSD